MKLIFLLLLVTVPFHLCSTTYKVLGEIPTHGSASYYPSTAGTYNAFHINVYNYQIGSGVYFKVSLTSGTFENPYMYVGGSNEIIPIGNTISLSTPFPYYYLVENTNSRDYYFVIYKRDSYNYYYIAPPPPINYRSDCKITIINTQGPSYYILGDIKKFGTNVFTPSKNGIFGVYCFDTLNYSKEKDYYFRTIITNGVFSYGNMYYGGSDTKLKEGKEVTLSFNVAYYSSRSTSDYSFTIPRIRERYLYVAPPPPYNYIASSTITVYNTYSYEDKPYKNLGLLTKYGSRSFDTYTDGVFCTFYIKTSDFSSGSKFYFNASTSYGTFEHKHMFYAPSNDEPIYGSTVYLLNNVESDLSDTFIIPSTNYKYLYIAPPPINGNTRAVITVYNTDASKSNAVAIGVGIGVAVLVVIIVLLSVVCYKRRSVNSVNIDNAEPIHLNATHY